MENKGRFNKKISLPKSKKENKEPMSITLTPTNKKKLKEMASNLNMSASELIAYWIENQT